jgi:methyltransferase
MPLPLSFVAVTVLTLVTLQRVAEVLYARRNEKRLLMSGAREYAPEHYWAIVALHSGWLAGLWLMVGHEQINAFWLAAFIGLQVLRLWVLATLKERWTTRIIVIPGAPLIKAGPYRFVHHPNYAIVAGEIFTLPMAFGLTAFAVVFSLLNAGILTIRIRAENRALRLCV